ncbi:hypothetical protein [Streptomyces sp. NPDC090445]|uniref:hypothetical protein n=1 Tax=Streptomyces sp. NPDC090445 TaxID=3365963 RepID=UPI0037F85C85
MTKSALVALAGAVLATGATFGAPAPAAVGSDTATAAVSGAAVTAAPLPDKFPTHAAALARLRAGGLAGQFPDPVSTNHCSTRKKDVTGCTSLERINVKTVEGMRIFAQKSNCRIQITGGTEWGHAPRRGDYNNHKYKSHWNGYKLDISPTDCVGNYIKSHYRRDGSIDGHPKYVSGGGNWYVDEGDHWDVTYF